MLSMLKVTSLSCIFHWFIHVVDNFNVTTNLICNKPLFQQTGMAKTQMHYMLGEANFPP